MRVLDLTPEREAPYERFVRSHPAGLFYHSVAFRDFLVHVLGCTPRYAIAVTDGDIVGVLPLMAAEGRHGQVLNSLPYFGSNGGILAKVPDAGLALAGWYRDALGDPAVAAGTVVGNPVDAEPVPVVHDLIDERVGHVTSLDGTGGDAADQLRGVIDGSARRNVRKAEEGGVEVNLENHNLAELEMLHRESMEVAGGVAKTRSFFDAVAARFRPGVDYKLYVARLDDEPTAALLLFYYGTTVEYYVPALRYRFRPFQPMAAILQQAMTEARVAGYRRWNWGGSWLSQESLIRFKSKWGGRGTAYRYWTKVNASALLSSTSTELLGDYPGFYVLPFSALTQPDGKVPA